MVPVPTYPRKSFARCMITPPFQSAQTLCETHPFLKALQSDAGLAALKVMEEAKGNVLQFRLQGAFPSGFPAFLATLVLARQKYADRFPLAHNMVFTTRAAEQATGERIAYYKTRFAHGAKRILVACSGLGGELMHLVRAFPHAEIVAVDADPDVLAYSAWNTLLVADHPNLQFVCARLEDVLPHLGTFDHCFFDPDRRTGGKRRLALADYTPDPNVLIPELLNIAEAVHTKVSPMLRDFGVHLPHAITWIEEGWTLKECVLHHGTGTYPSVVHIEGENILEDPVLSPASPTAQEYLVELSPALLRAGQVDVVASALSARRLHPKSSLLLTKSPVAHPMLRYYAVEKQVPFAPKQLKKQLRGLSFVVKKRFFPLEPREILRLLSVKEGGDTVLFCTTVAPATRVAFFCKRGIVGA